MQCPSVNSDDPDEVLRCMAIRGGHTTHHQVRANGTVAIWEDPILVEEPAHPLARDLPG
jgi:hypothetical protein